MCGSCAVPVPVKPEAKSFRWQPFLLEKRETGVRTPERHVVRLVDPVKTPAGAEAEEYAGRFP